MYRRTFETHFIMSTQKRRPNQSINILTLTVIFNNESRWWRRNVITKLSMKIYQMKLSKLHISHKLTADAAFSMTSFEWQQCCLELQSEKVTSTWPTWAINTPLLRCPTCISPLHQLISDLNRCTLLLHVLYMHQKQKMLVHPSPFVFMGWFIFCFYPGTHPTLNP